MNFNKTNRTKVKRSPKRACYDKALFRQIVADAKVGHLAFNNHTGTHSIPMLFWQDEDYLYSHFSVESRLMDLANTAVDVCISFVIVDGLVLAKSAFHHSMNYRSAIVYGQCQLIDDSEKMLAAEKLMDLFDRDRWAIVRKPNRKELNATAIIKIPIDEAVVKLRQGPPKDKKADQSLDIWSGVIPYRHSVGEPERFL